MLQEWFDQAETVVFFGGAGVSTESGIPDFRSETGLYRQKFPYPAEVMLSHDFFFSHTEEFYRFYKENMLAPDARPNKAHLALAAFEQAGKLNAVITQNIDGLHTKAGSKRVYELHGSALRNHCLSCGAFYDEAAILSAPGVPRCEKCGGLIKPDVVLYGEGLDEEVVEGAVRALSQADLLIVAGTSLTVYPAAGMIRYFRGDRLVLINRDPTPMDRLADLVIRDPVGETLGRIRV